MIMLNETKQRKIAALKTASLKKKQSAQEKTEKAIEKLIKSKKKLSFTNIAHEAGVSVQYLYKYPEIKQRIQYLREQQNTENKINSKITRSEKSSQAIIQLLKNRVKSLELERKNQVREIEVLTGQIYELHGIQKLADRLKAENADLKQKLKKYQNHEQSSSSLNAPHQKSDNESKLQESNSNKIKSELDNLAIKINSTLAKLIIEVPFEVVMEAINALKEALINKKVRNPNGFLVSAIKNSWIPNQNYQLHIKDNAFDEWYELAMSKNIVYAAKKLGGVQYVLDRDDKWVLFENMLVAYPLEKLKAN